MAYYDDFEDDDEPIADAEKECPGCYGTANLMGILGDLAHCRCRGCGMECNVPVDVPTFDIGE